MNTHKGKTIIALLSPSLMGYNKLYLFMFICQIGLSWCDATVQSISCMPFKCPAWLLQSGAELGLRMISWLNLPPWLVSSHISSKLFLKKKLRSYHSPRAHIRMIKCEIWVMMTSCEPVLVESEVEDSITQAQGEDLVICSGSVTKRKWKVADGCEAQKGTAWRSKGI